MTSNNKKLYAVFIQTQLYISFRQNNIFNIQLNHPSSVLYSLHLIILESPIKRITLQNIKSSLYKYTASKNQNTPFISYNLDYTIKFFLQKQPETDLQFC